jgi:hypothetical protein
MRSWGKKRNGYAVAREAWMVDWSKLRTPLGLPGQRQGICTRTSFVRLRDDLPEKSAEHNFYVSSLSPFRAGLERMRGIIRRHWEIENCLHHVKDRTWLEDRHWVGNRRTGAMVTMLRSLACCLMRMGRPKALDPKAYAPERIEYFNRYPRRALKLLTGKVRL